MISPEICSTSTRTGLTTFNESWPQSSSKRRGVRPSIRRKWREAVLIFFFRFRILRTVRGRTLATSSKNSTRWRSTSTGWLGWFSNWGSVSCDHAVQTRAIARRGVAIRVVPQFYCTIPFATPRRMLSPRDTLKVVCVRLEI